MGARMLDGGVMGYRTLTLAETLAGAERAAKRVERWPQWKRDVSGLARIGTTGIGERDDAEIMLLDTIKAQIFIFHSEGWSLKEIGRRLGLRPRTVSKVLRKPVNSIVDRLIHS